MSQTPEVRRAMVVGSGPNGLAAAIRLAQNGLPVTVYEAADEPGGGLRSGELGVPGALHDLCASVLPLGVGSPFFRTLPLERYGLEYVQPAIPLAHPLDQSVAHIEMSLDATVAALGRDGAAYRRLVGPIVEHWDDIAEEILGPPVHMPRNPIDFTRFGIRGVWPASWVSKLTFRTPEARALFAGNAAHAVLPLKHPLTAALALVLIASAHVYGWPVARGGSSCVADALVAHLRDLGGEVVTGQHITSLDDVEPDTLVMLDTAPAAAASIAGDRFPADYQRSLRRFRHGPGVFKLDYVLRAPIPWRDATARQAATVHVGGGLEEMAHAEQMVADGRHPRRPFAIVAQPTAIDGTRAPSGMHVAWAYTHVPRGSTTDMTEAIEAQIERFAPGFRDVVTDRFVTTPNDLAARELNAVGGDIAGGAMSGVQFLFRPILKRSPWATPDPLIYLCSASTPPGGGVHGMCGFNAAETSIGRLNIW